MTKYHNMQAQELLQELQIKKEKAPFWKKWWVKLLMKVISQILEEKTGDKK